MRHAVVGSALALGLVVASVSVAVSPTAAQPTPTTSPPGASLGNVVIPAPSVGILSSGGSGSFVSRPLRLVGTRTGPGGVVLRLYTGPVSFPFPSQFRLPPPCTIADEQLQVDFSTASIAGVAVLGARQSDPVQVGQVEGQQEGHAVAVAVVRVAAGTRSVSVRFAGGHTDQATPFRDGVAVLGSPVKAPPARPVPLLTDVNRPIGTVTLVDRKGRHQSLGALKPSSGGFPITCSGAPATGTTPTTAPQPLPPPTGTAPADAAAARQAVEAVYRHLFTAKANSNQGADIEGGYPLTPEAAKQFQAQYGDIIGKLTLRINSFEFVSSTDAALSFDLLLNGQAVTATTIGHAVLVGGQWKVARATFCTLLQRANIPCP